MFRTPISIPPNTAKIDHKKPIFTIGSCFSDCMGQRFGENKFEVLANPFGTVYNPVSIARLLSYAHKKEKPGNTAYTESHGLHANFDFHSSFSDTDKRTVEKRINESINIAHQFIKKSKWLIITLGTAFVYERADNHEIVSNCHKLPARQFHKKLLTQKQIITAIEPILQDLINSNSDLNIILTVSPVRHIKDTLTLNSVSKSTLRITCDTLTNNFDQVRYFPSYEIMMDDLRDYRFYKPDMIHPNEIAEDYIWEQFANCYFNGETTTILDAWAKVKAALNHKPFNPASEKHQNFLKQTIEHIQQLEGKINIQEEITFLKKQLK